MRFDDPDYDDGYYFDDWLRERDGCTDPEDVLDRADEARKREKGE